MYSYLVVVALVLHVLWWGVGLALLVMPRRWRAFWPVLVPAAGLALQSLVVWLAAYADLAGARSYALLAELLPAVLLGLALRRRRLVALGRDVARFSLVALVMFAGIIVLTLPYARAGRGLTTMALSSCDAADYAGGARAMLEFARSDRTGFLGLAEVTRVMSAEHFFDVFLRLNHFTPSALIAFNGAVLDCAPHELTGLMGIALLVLSAPMVHWIARALVGLRGWTAAWVAALYLFGAVTWYAVFQVALGQLLAALAIAVITWVGVAVWREHVRGGSLGSWAGVLALAYSLILGGYNFILLIAFTPVGAAVLWLAWRSGDWRRFGRWLGLMLLPLVLCGALWWERVAGLWERFRLFQTYDFGWKIPFLTPAGWLGLVASPDLAPISGLAGQLLSVLVLGAALGSLVSRARVSARRAAIVAALIGVPLAGYFYLTWRGLSLGTNASYDAYKVVAVFYPGILAGLCGWLAFASARRAVVRWSILGLAVGVSGLAAVGVARWIVRLGPPPLTVSRELVALGRIEQLGEIRSVNFRVDDMWSRLWANALLLRKPQYFPTHTYEGRINTPLKGDWDLESSILAVDPGPARRRQLSAHFALVDARAPAFVRPFIADGWNQVESAPGSLDRWQWTQGTATLRIENPGPVPLSVAVTLDGWSPVPGCTVQLQLGASSAMPVAVGAQRGLVDLGAVVVPPGGSVLTLRLAQPALQESGPAGRRLGICVFGLRLVPRQP
jgi:hypothetical protein